MQKFVLAFVDFFCYTRFVRKGVADGVCHLPYSSVRSFDPGTSRLLTTRDFWLFIELCLAFYYGGDMVNTDIRTRIGR